MTHCGQYRQAAGVGANRGAAVRCQYRQAAGASETAAVLGSAIAASRLPASKNTLRFLSDAYALAMRARIALNVARFT